MQRLSLLRLIEKFAEIHRQVSLRSLTAFIILGTIEWIEHFRSVRPSFRLSFYIIKKPVFG